MIGNHNRDWRSATALVATLALLFQAALGVFPCKARAHGAVRAGLTHQMGTAVLCAIDGARRGSPAVSRHAEDGSGLPTWQEDCSVCASAHSLANLLPVPDEIFLIAPFVVRAVFAAEALDDPLGVEHMAFRNRGPPSPALF